ncbi:MAG: ribbon-helix-helix protein, CopG family [Candidatus Fimenecus sp.]
MTDRKLVIPLKRFKGETGVVSIRLPNELIKSLDEIAEKTGRTRNEIMQKCLEFAVDNVEIE